MCQRLQHKTKARYDSKKQLVTKKKKKKEGIALLSLSAYMHLSLPREPRLLLPRVQVVYGRKRGEK